MKYVTRAVIAAVTFTVGIGAFCASLWVFPLPDVPAVESRSEGIKPGAISVNVFEMSEKSGKFVGKSVIVDATIYATGDYVRVSPNLPCHDICDPEGFDPFVLIDLDLTNYFGPNQSLKYLLRERKPFSEIDVRIRGTVKRIFDPDHLFLYSIEPENIEVISQWRKFEPKGSA